MTLTDSYDVLGLNADADVSAVKRAYRSKAMECHPDHNESPEAKDEFILIHKAYEVLLNHLEGRAQANLYDDILYKFRKEYRKQQVYNFVRKEYEEKNKEREAYHNSPFAWIFKGLYYGLFYLYIFCAMVFAFVPLWAGYEGGLIYFLICLPLFALSYLTVKMAMQWKREIEPLFE
jgi:curved DNA-binding protein CbpA